MSPGGQKFELQYHTQERFDLKNGPMHDLYKQSGVLDPLSNEYADFADQMMALSQTLKIPTDIGKVRKP